MKTLLTLVMAFSFSPIYAESASRLGMVTSSPDFNEPMSGRTVPYGESRMEAARKAKAKTKTDEISTSQSSTTRTTKKVMQSSPGVTKPAASMGMDCVDRSGQIFTNKDPGYSGCINSMKMK